MLMMLTCPVCAQVVSEYDASLDYEKANTQPISGDHFGMCKFTRDQQGQQRFDAVWRALKVLAERGMAVSGMPSSPEDNGQQARRPTETETFKITARQTAILESLCADNFHQYSADKHPTKGTGRWVENRNQFRSWRRGEKTKLWVYGNAATGKSYLAKHIINMLSAEENLEVVECFLDGRLKERNNLEAILRSTMHQAAKLNTEVWATAISQFKIAQSPKGSAVWTRTILRELWPTLMAQAVVSGSRIAIIIDGFDEISEHDQYDFLDCLQACDQELERLNQHHVLQGNTEKSAALLCRDLRVLILSRWCLSVDQSNLEFVQYKITEDDTLMDIRLTVETELARFARTATYSPGFQKEICDAVTRGARGIYLWATVMIADIRTEMPREPQLQQQLQQLPRSLAELYDLILGRIRNRPGRAAERTKTILLWVVFGLEPLTLLELNAGLALAKLWAETQGRQIDDDSVTLRMVDPGVFKAWLVMLCGQLLRMSSRNHVQPVHRTLVQYLNTRPDIFTKQHKHWKVPNHAWFYQSEREAHRRLGMLCAAYLMMPSFRNSGDAFDATDAGRAKWESKVQGRMESHELVRYSSLCWSKHFDLAGLARSKNPDKQQWTALEDVRTEFAISWAEVWWYARKWRGSDFPGRDVPLSIIIDDKEEFDSSLVPPAQSQWEDQPPSTDTLVATEGTEAQEISSAVANPSPTPLELTNPVHQGPVHQDAVPGKRSFMDPKNANKVRHNLTPTDPSPTVPAPTDPPATNSSHTKASRSTRRPKDRQSTNALRPDPLTFTSPKARPRTSSDLEPSRQTPPKPAPTSTTWTDNPPGERINRSAQPARPTTELIAKSGKRYVFRNMDSHRFTRSP